MKRKLCYGLFLIMLLFVASCNNNKDTAGEAFSIAAAPEARKCTSNDQCKLGTFCEFPPGLCGGKGECVRVPIECSGEEEPVCGCDKYTYLNDCYRKMQKMPKLFDGSCQTSESLKLEKPQNKYNLFDTLKDVWPEQITKNELAVLLADEHIVLPVSPTDISPGIPKVAITQSLLFPQTTGMFTFEQDDGENTGFYLNLDGDYKLYNYSFSFATPVDYKDGTPLLGAPLAFQHTKFIITGAYVTPAQNLDSVTLVDGLDIWLSQMQDFTYQGHDIMVASVANGQCAVNVDGNLQWITNYETRDFNGYLVTLLDVEDGKQKRCYLALGGREIRLRNNQEVEINQYEVDGSLVTFSMLQTGRWSKLFLTYEPQDDIYLPTGSSFVDPIFGAWKLVYQGHNENDQIIEFSRETANRALLSFKDTGHSVEIPYFYDLQSNSVKLGRDNDEQLLLPGECLSQGTGIEGTMMLYTIEQGESHVLEISDIDTANNLVDITDLTYGVTYEDKSFVPGQITTIVLGSLGPLKLLLNSTYLSFYPTYGSGPIISGESMWLQFNDTVLRFDELNASEAGESSIVAGLSYDLADSKIIIEQPALVPGSFAWYESYEDSDTVEAVTKKGTHLVYDLEEQGSLVVNHAHDEITAEVYLASIDWTPSLP
ncbi:hypothetical protein JW930_00900 [Candidatus Woesearchaeota archaeon]|nr:hypothetical protein [Candidatus Woesearchaeota archaeon]